MTPLVAPTIVEFDEGQDNVDVDTVLPVYYSQVFVREDSSYRTFNDLQGSRLAYNCEASLSGYHCLKNFVKALADDDNSVKLPFFKSVVRTGGHKHSAKAVCDSEADVCCLDCNIIADLLVTPEGNAIMSQLRSIELPSLSLMLRGRREERQADIFDLSRDDIGNVSRERELSCIVSENGLLGPNPAQPVVVSNRLSQQQMLAIKKAFLGVDDSVVPLPITNAAYSNTNIVKGRRRRKYVEVTSDYYNNIVMMMKELIDHQVICEALKGNQNLRSSVSDMPELPEISMNVDPQSKKI